MAPRGPGWQGGTVTADDEHLPDLELVRKVHRTLEPYHGIIYFTAEAAPAYAELGVTGPAGYFASRSAALGAVPAETVVATFFNFAPALVLDAMDGVWETTTPADLVATRLTVVDRTLVQLLGPDTLASPEMARAAALARIPAEEACAHLSGRPLFAAHASIEWPERPHLVLWHAVTRLREFRGDAHIAALLTAGLDGLDAIVIHAASRGVPAAFLRLTRGWSDEDWQAAVALHRETGWLAEEDGDDGEPVLSDEGRQLREEIEVATDRGSLLPWATIGAEGCNELRNLVRPWSRTLADAMFSGFTR
jgi:hypothetical protein